MVDIALTWSPALFAGDVSILAGDLASEADLRTAVEISLLTDRLANPDDAIPDGTADRRGWWGDLPRDTDPATPTADRIGSRLWLLRREKATADTARRAEEYAREALAWLVEDGVAARVDVVATWQALGFLALRVTITRTADPGGRPSSHTFDVAWSASTG